MISNPHRSLSLLLVLILTIACTHAETLRVIVGFHGEANPGVVSIACDASDDRGLAGVEFLIDADTISPVLAGGLTVTP